MCFQILILLDLIGPFYFFHLILKAQNYLKKNFLIFSCKKLYIEREPNTEPPMPINTTYLYLFNFLKILIE